MVAFYISLFFADFTEILTAFVIFLLGSGSLVTSTALAALPEFLTYRLAFPIHLQMVLEARSRSQLDVATNATSWYIIYGARKTVVALTLTAYTAAIVLVLVMVPLETAVAEIVHG